MWYRLTIAALFVGALGACQTENSSSLDESTYGSAEGAFGAAKTVMGLSCGGSCHQFHTLTEAQLIAQGLIVAGDAEGSAIYYRIAGSAGPSGPKNMPPGGALSQGDLDKIKTWIDGI